MIGNDIVDMADSHCHPRFARRIMTDTEYARWLRQETERERQIYLWKCWAAKEAAFKACRRLLPTAAASPRDFECHADFAYVTHKFAQFRLEKLYASDQEGFVTAVCQNSKSSLQVRTRLLKAAKPLSWQAESRQARSLAKQLIAESTGSSPEAWHFSKDPNSQAPTLIADPKLQAPWRIPCSLAHHGRYCLVSIGLPAEQGANLKLTINPFQHESKFGHQHRLENSY